MLPTIICYLPVSNGLRFEKSTWGLIEMARKLTNGHSKCIGIVVHCGIHSTEIAALPVDEVYHVKLEASRWQVADYHAEAFQQIQEQIHCERKIVLFTSDPLYQEMAARLSIRNHAGIITHAIELIQHQEELSSFIAKREIYRGKAHEFVYFNEDTKQQYVTMDSSLLYTDQQVGNPNQVTEVLVSDEYSSGIRFISSTKLDWEELKLTEASCVIGIGRGVYGAKSTDSISQLAELLNAPIGGSKVADELGLVSRDKRIGSSGSTIQADIYIAIGISGSSQHLEGIKGVKRVIAINNDPAAPIFQRCEIGIIGDFQEVLPALIQSLQEERQRETSDENLRTG